MIHWLTQSHTELPQATETEASYLNEEEQARLATMKTAKRRADWLLGRWTVKRLLQTIVWSEDGLTLPLDMITITNDAKGAPNYRLPFSDPHYAISISHSHGRAFAAAIEKPDAPIGADMERIEARPAGFAEAYFTPAELALGKGLSGHKQVVWETAVWSAKEAVLKALGLGLTVDTKAISCLIEPSNQLPRVWVPYAIKCDADRLRKKTPALTGWWRVEGNFVLTIAIG